MRNPILSRFSKLSRLPSTNLECRLDSTLDTLPNVPSVAITDSTATPEFNFCWTQYGITTATANTINQNYEIFGQISGSVQDTDRIRIYYYFLPQNPGNSNNWLTSVPYTDFPVVNTQVDEYTYVHQYAGNPTDLALVYGMYGIDDGTEEDFFINKRVTLQNGSFSFSVPLRRAGQYFVRIYCAVYEKGLREVPQEDDITMTTGVKILTPGPNYGTILRSGDINTIFA